MKIFNKNANKKKGTPIHLPNTKKIWTICIALGVISCIIGLVLWRQQGIDNSILFYFNDIRIANDPIVTLSQWLSSYGMAATTTILVSHLIASQKNKSLDAPLTVYLYTICSFGWGGVVGSILKEVFARPRPADTFGTEILVFSQGLSPSFPSGHAAKSIALILPFILLVNDSKILQKAIKVVIVLIALGICFSRIVLGAHYVSDVVAGVGIAMIGLPFSMMLANMVLRKTSQERLPFLSRIWGLLLIFLTWIFMVM